MFIGLFNDPLWLQGLSLDEVEWEDCEKVVEAVVINSLHLHGNAEEKHGQTHLKSLPSEQYSNPGTSEYEAGVMTSTHRRRVLSGKSDLTTRRPVIGQFRVAA
jgi:hypothetical protein